MLIGRVCLNSRCAQSPHKLQHKQHSAVMKLPPLPSCLGLLSFHIDSSVVTLQPVPPEAGSNADGVGAGGNATDGAAVATAAAAHATAFSIPTPGAGADAKRLVPTLRAELKTGKVSCSWARPLEASQATTKVLGVAGMVRLQEACIMILVTRVKRVACLWGQPVYKVLETHLVVHEAMNRCPSDVRYAGVLRQAYDPKTYAGHMYFSPAANITSSTQRQAVGPATPKYQWSAANPRFVWNRSAMQLLIDAGAEPFALPLMVGYVGQSSLATLHVRHPTSSAAAAAAGASAAAPRGGKGVGSNKGGDKGEGNEEGKEGKANRKEEEEEERDEYSEAAWPAGTGGPTHTQQAQLAVVARVSPQRITAGQWRLGLDKQGQCACFVETEMILTLYPPTTPAGAAGGTAGAEGREEGSRGASTSASASSAAHEPKPIIISHVQVRGSTPLCWASPPDLWPWPAPRFCSDTKLSATALRAHLAGLWKDYGQDVVLLNLLMGGASDALDHAAASSSDSSTQQQQVGRGLRPQLRLHGALQSLVESIRSNIASGGGDAGASGGGGGGSSKKARAKASGAAQDGKREEEQEQEQEREQEDGVGCSDSAAAKAGAEAEAEAEAGAEAAAPAAKQRRVQLLGHVVTKGPLELVSRWGAGRLLQALQSDLERHGMCMVETPPDHPAADPAAAAAPAARPFPPPLPRPVRAQSGVVRCSAFGGCTAGVCVGEVDLAQHAIAQHSILGAMLRAAHALAPPPGAAGPGPGPSCDSGTAALVAYPALCAALSEIWSRMSGRLADQFIGVEGDAHQLLHAVGEWGPSDAHTLAHTGTPSPSGTAPSAPAPVLMQPGGVLRGLYRSFMSVGDLMSAWYYINFSDAARQDALDLATGAHVPAAGVEHKERVPLNSTTLQVGMMLAFWAVVQVFWLLASAFFAEEISLGGVVAQASMRVGLPLLGAFGMLHNAVRDGTQHVEKPALCPDLVRPWQ